MHEPARRILFACAALLGSLSLSLAPTLSMAQDDEDAAVTATPDFHVPSSEPRYAAIVVDATSGEVLYEKRADSPRYPASITKIMTLYLAFEQLATGRLKESDYITVSPLAAAQAPTKLGLRPGESIQVSDAMSAIAVKSANDMAMALAERIGGSESRFAAMMTLKAQELGMTHTRFVNPNGLPDSRQVTSARDISILCQAVLRDYPQYYRYFGEESFTYRGQTMSNHNGLLGRMPGVDGFKTGFTNAAGFNLAASAVRDGHRLIAVVLGGSTSASRNANVQDLLLTGFDIDERRDRGETITLTQNMFEAPPAQAAMKPQIEQGDASDPIDLVLTAAAQGKPVTFPSANVAQLSASRPSLLGQASAAGIAAPPPAVGETGQARPARNWTVQVGAFHSGKLATRQVDFIADRFKALFDDREGSVDHVGRSYRAIFSGFTQTEAQAACSEVQSHNLPCVSGSN